MSLRNQLVTGATLLFAAACVFVPSTAAAQKLTAATLVPSELFPEGGGKNFGYPAGFSVVYMQAETGHRWRLAEQAATYATPTPTPTPLPAADALPVPATPTPDPTVAPTATPPPLEESADERDFDAEVEMLGPTFVTIIFAESAAAASDMVANFFDERKDWMKEEAKPQLPHPNLAVFKIEKDDKLRKGAVIFNREFNLGDKQGGFRRSSSVILSIDNVFLRIDARKGLVDTEYDGSESALEKRARAVATYLLKKM